MPWQWTSAVAAHSRALVMITYRTTNGICGRLRRVCTFLCWRLPNLLMTLLHTRLLQPDLCLFMHSLIWPQLIIYLLKNLDTYCISFWSCTTFAAAAYFSHVAVRMLEVPGLAFLVKIFGWEEIMIILWLYQGFAVQQGGNHGGGWLQKMKT